MLLNCAMGKTFTTLRSFAATAGILLLVGGTTRICWSAPTSAPAPAPTTTQTVPRRQLVMPPGFHRVTAGSRVALCEDADHAWVQHVLSETKPATQPNTMPADLVKMLGERRELLKGRITADLSLLDPAAVDKLFDQTLLPQAKKLQQFQVPVFYLVCTRDRLRQLLKSGWEDPRFYYNRAADDVAFDTELRLTIDRPMDDMIMPAVYPADTPASARETFLANVVRRNELSVADAVSRQVQVATQIAMIEFIHEQAVAPLKLKPDQEWFGLGVEQVLACRYMADLTGGSYEQYVDRMQRDDPRNRIRAATIDLLHPSEEQSMRREWVPLYRDAYRVKSARVIHELISKAGLGAVPMVLSAGGASPPPPGPRPPPRHPLTAGGEPHPLSATQLKPSPRPAQAR